MKHLCGIFLAQASILIRSTSPSIQKTDVTENPPKTDLPFFLRCFALLIIKQWTCLSDFVSNSSYRFTCVDSSMLGLIDNKFQYMWCHVLQNFFLNCLRTVFLLCSCGNLLGFVIQQTQFIKLLCCHKDLDSNLFEPCWLFARLNDNWRILSAVHPKVFNSESTVIMIKTHLSFTHL